MPAFSFSSLAAWAQLTPNQLALAMGIALLAGMVRGFSGFGLSALVMASLTFALPPIQIMPIAYVLESASSLVMIRGGWRQANRRVVFGLVMGSWVGLMLGLQVTHALDPFQSRLAALSLIVVLAVLQLLGYAPAWLASKKGVLIAGLLAGFASGIAFVGGMVVALYVLASRAEPKVMRASLVVYLFVGMLTSGVILWANAVLTPEGLARGLVLAPCAVLGVLAGAALFRPALQPYYRGFCLALLLGLSLLGLLRLFW